MAISLDIYHRNGFHKLSILDNPYIITKIREFMSNEYDSNIFNDTFEDMRKFTELARNKGVLALNEHTVKNKIIQEFIELMIVSVTEYAKVQQERGPYIDFEFIEYPAFFIIPKILYSDLEPVELVKTVLLYESIIMSITGYSWPWIEHRLNGVNRR